MCQKVQVSLEDLCGIIAEISRMHNPDRSIAIQELIVRLNNPDSIRDLCHLLANVQELDELRIIKGIINAPGIKFDGQPDSLKMCALDAYAFRLTMCSLEVAKILSLGIRIFLLEKQVCQEPKKIYDYLTDALARDEVYGAARQNLLKSQEIIRTYCPDLQISSQPRKTGKKLLKLNDLKGLKAAANSSDIVVEKLPKHVVVVGSIPLSLRH